MGKERKIRAEFRKNRNVRARRTDWTRQFDEHGFQEEAPRSPSGSAARATSPAIAPSTVRRFLRGDEPALDVCLEVDESCLPRAGALGPGADQHRPGRGRRRSSSVPPGGC